MVSSVACGLCDGQLLVLTLFDYPAVSYGSFCTHVTIKRNGVFGVNPTAIGWSGRWGTAHFGMGSSVSARSYSIAGLFVVCVAIASVCGGQGFSWLGFYTIGKFTLHGQFSDHRYIVIGQDGSGWWHLGPVTGLPARRSEDGRDFSLDVLRRSGGGNTLGHIWTGLTTVCCASRVLER